jgi:hypothetical protein
LTKFITRLLEVMISIKEDAANQDVICSRLDRHKVQSVMTSGSFPEVDSKHRCRTAKIKSIP